MLTLVDTSVWVDHFRNGNEALVCLLEEDNVLSHPFVIGELACGHLKNRKTVIDELLQLPKAKIMTFEEVFPFIDLQKLEGKGIGIVDVHILGACLLSNARLFTLDKKLERVSRVLIKN